MFEPVQSETVLQPCSRTRSRLGMLIGVKDLARITLHEDMNSICSQLQMIKLNRLPSAFHVQIVFRAWLQYTHPKLQVKHLYML